VCYIKSGTQIPNHQGLTTKCRKVQSIALAKFDASDSDCRIFNEEKLAELASSIKNLRGDNRMKCGSPCRPIFTKITERRAAQLALFDESVVDLKPIDFSRFTFATSRYQNKTLGESGLAPVGITRGYPRFRLGYKLFAYERSLAPTASQFQMDDRAEFTTSFLETLDANAEKVMATIYRHSAAAQDQGYFGIAFLCYEDVFKPGEWCHRQVLAQWLNSRHGMVVGELDL
jgi:hypothetical protein